MTYVYNIVHIYVFQKDNQQLINKRYNKKSVLRLLMRRSDFLIITSPQTIISEMLFTDGWTDFSTV